MNLKRATLIVILLTVIGLRHSLEPDQGEKITVDALAPAIASLSDIHLETDALMRELIDHEMKAPPDQDYLITMVIDALEKINLSCFYHREMLDTLVSGGITAEYRLTYTAKLKNNMRVEIAWIQSSMERITSIHPMIREKPVLDAIRKSQEIAKRVIRLFEDTTRQMDEWLGAADG